MASGPRPLATVPGPIAAVLAIAVALLGAHLLVARQSIHQASPLLLGDWLFAIALAAAVLALAAALGRRVGRPLADPLQAPLGEWLAALGLGYGLLSQAILIAGFLRLYYGPVFLLATVALLAWLRRDLRHIAARIVTLPARIRADPLLAAARPVHRLLALTAALIALAAFARGLIPITGDVPDWDAVAYHLAAPKIYLQLHSFVPLPDMPLANTPSAADLFSIPGLLIGSENLERYLDILLGLGLAAATYSFGARHHSRAAGLLGAALLLHTFWIVELLPAASPDFATAFLMVLGFSDAFAALHPAAPYPAGPYRVPPPEPAQPGPKAPTAGTHRSGWGTRWQAPDPEGFATAGSHGREVPSFWRTSRIGGLIRNLRSPASGPQSPVTPLRRATPTPEQSPVASTQDPLGSGPCHDPSGSGRAGSGRAGSGRAESGRAGSGRAESSRAGSGRTGSAGRTDRLLIRSGLLIGFSVSCKLTSLPAIPATAAVIGIVLLCRRGAGPLAAARSVALFGIATLVPLAIWLLKNRYFFGNPLYPQTIATTTQDCRGATACTSIAAHATGHPAILDRLGYIAGSFIQILWSYTAPFVPGFGGNINPLIPLLLLAPWVVAPYVSAPIGVTRPAFRGGPAPAGLLLLAIGGLLWLLFVPLFLPPRYWLGLLAVTEVLLAATLLDMVRRLGRRGRPLATALLGYLALEGLLTLLIAIGLAGRSGGVGLALGQRSRYDYLTERVRPYRAIDYLNTRIPDQAPVAMVHVTLGYYVNRTRLNDWYGTRFRTLEYTAAGRRAELSGWCRAGVRYAIFNRGADGSNGEYNPDALAGIRPLAAFAWPRTPGLHPRVLFSARGVDVLALTPCTALAGGTP